MSKIVLIDGHSILNRAFYGVPDLTNADGLHTNAIYGFLNIMFHFLAEEKPEYLTVAFDLSAPTFRHEMYAAYKGTRKPMLPELKQQVPVMKEVLTAMGVKLVMQEGLEADDLLGTIAKRAEAEGMEVSLVSGDRDLLQIASSKIKIRIPKTKGNVTTVEDYYAADVEALYGVGPTAFIDIKALMGDSSDNIPGVPKVGEKTAKELIGTYGSLDALYAHVDDVSKNAIRESLKENQALAYLCKELATINVKAEFPYSFEEARIGNLYTKEAYELFKKLGFKKFLDRFDAQAKEETVKKELIKKQCSAVDALDAILADHAQIGIAIAHIPGDDSMLSAGADGQICFDFTPHTERMLVYITNDGEVVHIFDSEVVGFNALQEMLHQLYQKQQVQLSTFDVKRLYSYFSIASEQKSVEVATHFADTLIAAYLLNPLKNDYLPEDVASEYADMQMQGYKECFGKLSLREALDAQSEAFHAYYMAIAASSYLAMRTLLSKLEETKMLALYNEIEMPLSYVLYAMEKEGICARREELSAYSQKLGEQIEVLEKKIYEGAGEEFNINSPKQLGEILFEKKGLPGGKKTKTGYSTAAEVLEKLAATEPFVKDILEYRALTKLKSTYADGLATFIAADGRIHSSFNQTITATGRISSTDPNLQNIPMRTEMGRLIRKVFVPSNGNVFVDGDYSQVELRILAHMAGDEELLNAYRQNQDIHRSTAAKVFHTPFEEVTDLQRRNAKAVNFGIVYGISAFGLSQDLDVSRKEAEGYIEAYFATYPGIKKYLDDAVAFAKEHGYSETLYHRRRPIPELLSSNFMQRQFGERVAMNAPIQGTAADIMKIVMLKVYDALIDQKLAAKLILQIHDELLIECPPEEEARVMALLSQEMESAATLRAPLTADLHSGKDFYEVK